MGTSSYISFVVDDRPQAQRLVVIYKVSSSNIGPPTRIYRKYRGSETVWYCQSDQGTGSGPDRKTPELLWMFQGPSLYAAIGRRGLPVGAEANAVKRTGGFSGV